MSIVCTASVVSLSASLFTSETLRFRSQMSNIGLLDRPGLGVGVSVVSKSPCMDSTSGNSETDTVPILPRATKVIVIGNNRTKRSLIGQTAVVKKAVGLGGWHFLVLENGEEVKLQRNALSVVEYGPDDHQESSSDEMTETREPQIEILTRPRVRRPPKALSPVPDIFKPSGVKMSWSSSGHCTSLVNLAKLEVVSLMRYRRVFQLGEVGPAASRDELMGAVRRHFATQEIDEDRVLAEFKAAVRRRYKQQQLMLQQYPTHYAHLQEQQQQRPRQLYPSIFSRQLGQV